MKTKKENQYTKVAREAYEMIKAKKLSDEEAWHLAAERHIKSFESRKKGCPRAAFFGLCRSGDLKGIGFSANYVSKNYDYAMFAATEWSKNKSISKKEMWSRVQKKFNTTAKHQGQLDVVMGVLEFCITSCP